MRWKKTLMLALAMLMFVANGVCDLPKPSQAYLYLMEMLKEDPTCLNADNGEVSVWLSIMNADSADSLEIEIFEFRWDKFHDATIHEVNRGGMLAGMVFDQEKGDVQKLMEESVANDTFGITASFVLAQWGYWEKCIDSLVSKGEFWPLIEFGYEDAASVLLEAMSNHDDPAYKMSAAIFHDRADTVNTIAPSVAAEVLDKYVKGKDDWNDTLALNAAIFMAYEAVGSNSDIVAAYLEPGTNDDREVIRSWSMSKLMSMALSGSCEPAVSLLHDLAENSEYDDVWEQAEYYYWIAMGATKSILKGIDSE